MVKFSRERLEEITNRKLNFEVKDNNLILATSLEDTKLGDVVQDVEGSSYEWFQIFDQNDQPYKIRNINSRNFSSCSFGRFIIIKYFWNGFSF